VDGLAQAFGPSSFEAEAPAVDDGLVADIEVVQAGAAVDGEPRFPGAEDGDVPGVAVGELTEGGPCLVALGGRADGVRGDEAHAPEQGVGDDAFAPEEVVLVVAEGEVGQGVAPVAGHDGACPRQVGPETGAAGDGRAEGEPAGGDDEPE